MASDSHTSKSPESFPALETFKATFNKIPELPYCGGTVPLNEASSTLFYRRGDKASALEFGNATDAQLSSLAEACELATFGRNDEDVLDESYRKAGKLDAKNFATQFSPVSSGIVQIIRKSLLQGRNAEEEIKVELYKLNVYGPGSFFKAHVDTPRSDTMFGSLVVIFPTSHEGGSLMFRHEGQQQTFDTASAVSASSQTTPHAAFVAFFSDIEHEVSLVTSGYRVTLTYNLYFTKRYVATARLGIFPDKDPLEEMKFSLSSLLSDPEFLPAGGLLGFQLSHKYPFKPDSTVLLDLARCLKGSDAIIKSTCEEISMPVSLKSMYIYKRPYPERKMFVLANKLANFNNRDVEAEELDDFFRLKCKATFVYSYPGPKPTRDKYADRNISLVPIVWIKMKAQDACNSWKQPYMVYGNEMRLDHMYGEVCLVAAVKPFVERSAV